MTLSTHSHRAGAFMFDSPSIRGLSTHQIFEEKLCLAVPSGHFFAALPSIRAEQLAGEPLIATPPDVALTLRDADLRFFRSGGVTPTIRLEAQLQQTIVSLVAEELGVALVLTSMSRLGLPDVVFLALEAALYARRQGRARGEHVDANSAAPQVERPAAGEI